MSSRSFFYYSLNNSFLIGYIVSFCFILFNLKNPIYIEDISIFSQYRYGFLSILSFVAFIIIFLTCINHTVTSFLNNYNFPYLKEEIRIVLYSWNNGWIGSMCAGIISTFWNNVSFRRYFFIIYLGLNYIPKLMRLGIFVWFCFLHGDFRYFIYFSPVFFILWVVEHLFYYLAWFVDANLNYLNTVIERQINVSTMSINDNEFFMFTKFSDITVTLTPYAYEEGYTQQDSFELREKWFHLSLIKSYLAFYKKYVFSFKSILLLCYSICWFYLAYKFFFSSIALSGGNWPRFSSFIRSKSTCFTRQPFDARYVKGERAQTKLVQETKGAYGPDHMIFGEQQKDGSYSADGQFTYGNGHANYPTKPFSNDPIKPNSTKGGPQMYNHFEEPVYLKPNEIHPPVPDSETKLNTPESLSKLKQQNHTDD